MGHTTSVSHNVHVRLNVGDTPFLQTSHDISQEVVLNRVNLVPTTMDQNRVEHFVDTDPTNFLFYLDYFHTLVTVCGERTTP
jgi:hypothetical protein